MALRSDATHWGSLAKAFHWIIVLLILVQGTLGLVMVELPKKPAVIAWYTLHKSIGLSILVLVLLRLAWRAVDPRPLEPPATPRWQALAARLGHALLYVLLIAVPIVGIAAQFARGRPVPLFGLGEIASPWAADRAFARSVTEVHELLANTLLAVACLHAAAALAHHWLFRDRTLTRMLPGAR